MGDMVQAQDSFSIGFKDGSEQNVLRGEIFDEDHEIVRRTQGLGYWAPLHIRGEVESATAAPGEKRTARVKKTDAAEK
jgi:hypothetical protein